MRNFYSDFYPCYIDIEKANIGKAFSIPYKDSDSYALSDFKDYFNTLSSLYDIFTPDKIDEFAEEYFKYYPKIASLYKNAGDYLNKKDIIQDEIDFGATWEDTVLFLYEKYRMAQSLYETILYDLLLHDFLWNSTLDPNNPMIRKINLSIIEKLISPTFDIAALQETAIGKLFTKVKNKFDKYQIDVDEDGTILIKKNYKADLQRYFANASNMLKLYRDNDNLVKLKSELAKIYYINELIEIKYVYNNNLSNSEKAEYKEFMDLRSRILSSFKTYMSYVISKDKEFDFNDYYENSPYAKVFTVKREQLKGLKKLFNAIAL